jgi:glycosyltransferase involved in cell wall biosynthesis
MPIDATYWVLVTTRNRHENLRRTLQSLWHQTLQPRLIIVFDDGSNPRVANDDPERQAVLRREDEGYDINRIVVNWNACLSEGTQRSIATSSDYLLISADDCEYPPNYAESLIEWMRANEMQVASGSRGIKASWDGWKAPEGTGRMISTRFLKEIGFHIPERAGYEPWIFLEAMRRGYNVGSYSHLQYVHLEKFGGGHGFVQWGHIAHALGYDPIFFTARCLKNLATSDLPRGAVIRMYLVYLKDFIWKPKGAFYQGFSDEFRAFVKSTQRKRLLKLLRISP